ncbi:LysR substrate-binding domain-containing protein [Kibdelosporangium phytohabitans]|uniref:LysR substrate-binding domain-containing protein n=1 Tax=Kibdelosporangium phytohabitans TaxID=860235 RepID=UPI0009FB4C30
MTVIGPATLPGDPACGKLESQHWRTAWKGRNDAGNQQAHRGHDRIRLGVSEDLVQSCELPELLRRFRDAHPLVEPGLVVELSTVLRGRLAAGKVDLTFAKRGHDEPSCSTSLADSLSWACVPVCVWTPPSRCRSWSIRSRASPAHAHWTRCGAALSPPARRRPSGD